MTDPTVLRTLGAHAFAVRDLAEKLAAAEGGNPIELLEAALERGIARLTESTPEELLSVLNEILAAKSNLRDRN